MPPGIQIFPAEQIDKQRWDNCIERSANGLIYSRYDYLETICDNWHAVVTGDYETVMALPWRKRFGTRYLYEPPFIQQLGFIGTATGDALALRDAVYSFAKYGDLLLNYSNHQLAQQLKAPKRTNFIIDLSMGYDAVYPGYAKDLKYNLRRIQSDNYSYSGAERISEAVALFRSVYGRRFPHVSAAEYEKFTVLCHTLYKKGMCFTRNIADDKGVLLCIAVFLKDEKRIYNIMNTTTTAGRTTKANELLLDLVIKEFSGQPLLFDFEGSDLPGVKSFYEKFGAVDQPYYHYHFNRLPFPLKLFKR
jgi:hypothetical protein